MWSPESLPSGAHMSSFPPSRRRGSTRVHQHAEFSLETGARLLPHGFQGHNPGMTSDSGAWVKTLGWWGGGGGGRALCVGERKSGGVHWLVREPPRSSPPSLYDTARLVETTLAAMLNRCGTRAYKSQKPGPAAFPPGAQGFGVSRGLNGRM